MFNPAAGTVDLSRVEITGSPKTYVAQLGQIPGGPYLFQLASASKIPPGGCPAATYQPATGMLDIPYLGIMGTAKAYAVEMMKQPGPGFVFQMTSATKQ